MGYLLVLGFLAGLIVAISPCVVPVLPIVLSTGATSENRRRPLLVICGLMVSFTAIVLFGSVVLGDLGLPKDLLRNVALLALLLVGIGMLVPKVGEVLERPFRKVGAGPRTNAGSFVLGLSLGAVYVPCAGPVLAAITVLGAQAKVGAGTVILTLGYASGTALPLLAIAFAAKRASSTLSPLKKHAKLVRKFAGVLVVVTTVGLATNLFSSFQTAVPGYTSALQNAVESSSSARNSLGTLTHAKGAGADKTLTGQPSSGLPDYGPAPEFSNVTKWLNTPQGKPLSLSGLRGKVVLVDFWTYSCINCLRSLPHVEAWYGRYSKEGLVVVGVHTPEFPFEYVASNVEQAVSRLGVEYPVAIDDKYGTWDAYGNEYWPAEYLIDRSGRIREVSYGEGGYAGTEGAIRELLSQKKGSLPSVTSVSNTAPAYSTTQESYLGYDRVDNYAGNPSSVVKDHFVQYSFPKDLSQGYFSLSGQWKVESSGSLAGDGAQLELAFEAKDVYLVMSGSGSVGITLNGTPQPTIQVKGIPDIYQVVSLRTPGTGTLALSFTGSIEAYDFTFG